jgi:protein-disulfide isomerase
MVAAAFIALATGYVGRQLASCPDEARIVALIDERLNAQRQEGRPAEKGIAAMIEQRLGRQKGREPSEQEFNARVERGIIAYVDKQRRAEQERPNQLARNVPPPAKDDHVYGNPEAPVTLIEYSDFECPFCKRFHITAKELVDRSNGQVGLVYRHFPLDFHNPGARKEAEAAECAAKLGGNDVFWKYADAIYLHTHSNGKGFPVDNLVPLAAKLGLNQESFRQCLDSSRMSPRIQHDIDTGTKAGVEGTPGNILWAKRTGKVVALHGAQPYERLSDAARELLTAK